jgi:uncharacterized protein (TIGR02172 family)
MNALAPGPLVGRGLTSDVFEWENGRVLKLFFTWMPRPKIEREYNVSRAIQGTGFPAPQVFELIEMDGRLGIIFERIDGISMFRTIQRKPWKLYAGALELAGLHARMHDVKAPPELPTQREQLQGWIDAAKDFSTTELQAARAALAKVPEGESLCHGDFHPENILYSSRGPIVIDWITGTRGDPVLDVARSRSLFLRAAIPEGTPFHMRLVLHTCRAIITKVYLSRYFKLRPGPRHLIESYEPLQRAAHSAWRSLRVN